MSTPSLTTMTFAERLAELRTAAGLTQRQLGERAAMSTSTISNYEQGLRQPNWIALFQLCRALGVTHEAFADCAELQPRPKKRKSKK
jgi:transcriptional regulator with XRE-family HTH domain